MEHSKDLASVEISAVERKFNLVPSDALQERSRGRCTRGCFHSAVALAAGDWEGQRVLEQRSKG